MSTDWHIFCLDCEEEHGFNDANHQDDLMRQIIRAAPGIAALAPYWHHILSDVVLRTYHGNIDPAWFAKHAGHRLAPRSEYGEIDGSCAEDVTCECGRRHHCALPKGHEGKHSRHPLPGP